ncbi:hypothetical protein DRO54_03415 [Candidatus Bathyarchaeota archaeon]|nr:MAG: hypothetical protein DRO54_03415 [Candidatus Bathyarchaeota archaeon]
MSELLKWFERRREERAIQMIKHHLSITVSIVEDLEKAIHAAIKGQKEEMRKAITRVAKNEEEADKIRRKVMDELSHGELSPIDREDLMNVVKGVDMVADWSHETARLLAVLPMEEVPESVKKACIEMMEGVKKCVFSLRKCVSSMIENPKEALNAADEVEREEEKVDDLHRNVRRALVQEREIRASVAVLVNEFNEALEMISDWCEDTCDQVRIIMIRR